MKPVIIVRNEAHDPGGTVLRELRREGLTVRFVDAHRDQEMPGTDAVSGIVVFGGVQHADDVDTHPYLKAERELLHDASERGVPVLGICLGGQLLALAKGASLRPAPVREFGFTPIEPTPEGKVDPVMSVWEPGDRVFHWHEDTFEMPDGATLLLQGEHVRNQGFRYGDAAWGVQFHPEVTREVLEGWLGVAGDTTQRWGKSPDRIREEAGLHLAREEERAGEMVRRFAGVIRGRR